MENDECKYVLMAVKEFIITDEEGFPPKIGQVKQMAKRMKSRYLENQRMLEQERLLRLPEKEQTQEELDFIEDAIARIRESLKYPGEE